MTKREEDLIVSMTEIGMELSALKAENKILKQTNEQLSKALDLANVRRMLPNLEIKGASCNSLGDTFIDYQAKTPEQQWRRIDEMLEENGLCIVQKPKGNYA